MICVGGPLDGKDIETEARWLTVPDAKDRIAYVADDGSVLYRFGEHVYERKYKPWPLYFVWVMEYQGYQMPVAPR